MLKRNPVRSWSYSRYETYDECPLRFKLRYIDKLPEPESKPLARGNAVHKESEDWLGTVRRGRLEPRASTWQKRAGVQLINDAAVAALVPESLSAFAEEFYSLATMNAVEEDTWILDRDWRPVPLQILPGGKWVVDWTRVWLILKLDAHAHRPDRSLEIVDVKTGKVREKSVRQTELYAIGGFAVFDVDEVRTRLWYVDSGDTLDAAYTVDEAGPLAADWEQRIEKMFADTRFAPNPGYYCRWCVHRKENGGPCPY